MMKKILSTTLSLLVAATFSLVGCSDNTPKKVAKDAVEHFIAKDMSAFYDQLSTKDQNVITKDNFVKMYKFPDAIEQLITIAPEAQKEIKASKFKETISNDYAKVTYILKVPDLSKIGDGFVSAKDLYELPGGLTALPEDMRSKITDYIKNKGVPTMEVVQQMELVKEDKQWKVDLQLPTLLPDKGVPYAFSLESE